MAAQPKVKKRAADADEEAEQKSKKSKRAKSNDDSRHIKADWLDKYPWLIKWEGNMKCQICIDSNLNLRNPFVAEAGCSNFRTSTLTRHQKSGEHKRAITSLKLSDNMATVMNKALHEKDQAIIKLLRTVYYIAKEESAIMKFESLIELLDLSGVDLIAVGAGYRSRTSAVGFLQALDEAVDATVSQEISDSEFLSISCDETTDISNTGKLILYVKTVDEKLNTSSYFIGDYDITDKTANGLTTKLKDCFEEAGIDIMKTMALGTDGASTMTGRKNGVGAQLRRENPYMIQFHCAAHKLALCTSQAAENVTLLKRYKETLTSIYFYFKGSHNREDKLKEI